MSKRSDDPDELDRLRDKIVGLGERSVRKSYYPRLQQQIQELERTKELLRELSRRYESILDSAGEGIFGLDLEGNYTFMNRAAAAMLGYEPGELLGKHSHACIHHTRADGTCYPEEECRTYAAFRDGKVSRVDDEVFCRKDGTRFPVEYTSTPIVENDKLTGAVVIFSDITERKKAEDALKESEWRLEFATTLANEAIWDWDLVTDSLNRNAVYTRSFGEPPEGSRPADWWKSRIHPEDSQRVLASFARVFKGMQDDLSVEYRFLLADGAWGIVHDRAKAIRNRQGEPIRLIGTMLNVTERRQAENRIRESEENLRTIMDSVYDAVFIHDLDGTILDVNRRMLDLYHIDREQALHGRIAEDFSAPDNPFDRVPGIWKRAIAGEDQFFEWKARRPNDSSTFPVEVFLHKIRFQDRELILATVRDVTERKRAEDEVKRTKELLEEAQEIAGIGNWEWNARTNRLTWSDEVHRIFNVPRDRFPGTFEAFMKMVHPADRDIIERSLAEAAREHKETTYNEYRIIRPDGTVRTIHTRLRLEYDSSGAVTATRGTAQDLTEARMTEQTLKLTQFSLDHAAISVFFVAPDAGFRYVNEQACRTLGYTREELLSMGVYDIDPGRPLASWSGRWQQIKKERSLHFETLYRRKDGALIPMEMRLNYLSFAGQEYDIAFGLDISERKRAENALTHAYALTKTIIDSMNDAISLIDVRDFTIVDVNRVFLENYGYRDKSEVAGKHCYQITHHRDDVCSLPDDVCPLVETVRTKDHFSADHVHYDKNGEKIYVEVSTSPIRDDAGNVIQVVHVQRNITERKRAEEALRISEERFRNLFRQSSISMQVLSPEGRIIEVNPAFEALWGMTLKDLQEYNILRDRQLIAKGIMPYIQKGFAGEAVEIPVVRYDPTEIDRKAIVRWVKAFIYPVKRDDGAIHQLVLMHMDVTETVEAEEALRASEERFRAFFELAAVGAIEADPTTGQYLRVNDRFCRMMGYSREELLLKTFPELTHPDDRAGDAEFIEAVISGELREYSAEKRYLHKDGHTIWGHLSVTIISDAQGRPVRTVAIVQDITERKHAEEALRRNEAFLRRVIDNLIAFVAVLNSDGVLIEVNRSALETAGIGPDDVLGKKFEDTYWFNWSPDARAQLRRAIEKGMAGEVSRFDMEVRIAGGAIMPIDFMLAPIVDEEGKVTHLLPSAIDIASRKQMEDQIRHLAHHDTLTGLPNRRLFNEIASLELAQAERNRKKFAVLFLDLDRFKEINDTLGHEAGDQLLKEVACRLRATLRRSDSVGRIGGDEFNIILADLLRPDDVSDIARKIVETVRRPFVLAGHELRVTVSIGISIFPDDGTDLDTLLRYADMAMYHAKETGRNVYQFYNPSINSRSIERMRLENMLRRSLELGEMEIHYQPLVDVPSGNIICAEALLRWRHPEQGLLTPGSFMATAEETGFVAEIDEWVLGSVCRQIRAWTDAGVPVVCVTVNLSTRQFQSPELLGKLGAILKETGAAAQNLDIEVPESTAMRDVERSAALMRNLAALGVHISIDDFGTGYSSLNYLRRMPIEKLKIDKSFMQDLSTDRDGRAIVRAVTAMAHSMNIKVIAEGVETGEQLTFLREIGCDEAQGFLFSRPVTAERFKELVMK